MEESDDTAIVAQKKILTAKTTVAKILYFIVGVSIAGGPVVAGRYALQVAKLEAQGARESSRREASRGYETLAGPLEDIRGAIKILDWRVQRLEEEHAARASTQPISPEPLQEPALERRVPQTLGEATKE